MRAADRAILNGNVLKFQANNRVEDKICRKGRAKEMFDRAEQALRMC